MTWRKLLPLLFLTACRSPGGDSYEDVYRDSTTSLVEASTTVTAPPPITVLARVDKLQVAGTWTVDSAGPRAPFRVEDQVTFGGDGHFSLDGPGPSWGGTWRVRNYEPGHIGEDGVGRQPGAELSMVVNGVLFNYSIEASPRQLRLVAPDDGMVLIRYRP